MSEHVDRFSYIQKRTKPIGTKEKNIVPSTRLKANLSKERGESIKLLSKTETHKSRNKSLARDWRCIAMLQLGVNWLISNHIVREAVVILQRSYLTPTISSPVQLITRKKWTSHWVVVRKQSNYPSELQSIFHFRGT